MEAADHIQSPADALTQQVAENLRNASGLRTRKKPERIRPTTAEHQAQLDAADEQYLRMKSELIAERDALAERLAYFWRWQWVEIPALLMLGALAGRLL